MLKIRTLFLVLFLLVPLYGENAPEAKQLDFVKENIHIYPVKEYRVIDGDTIEVVLDIQFGLTMKTSIRIIGINTPEVRGDKEKRAGLAVKSLVEQWLKNHETIYCQVIKEDKFGGRFDGRIITPTEYTLSEYLLDNKLAQEYDGKTAKNDFTEKELDDIENNAYNLLLEEMENE